MHSIRCFLKLSAILLFACVAWSVRADDTIYTKVDVAPVPVKTPQPEFPFEMKRQGITGVVAVSVVIDESGSVSNSAVVKSSRPEFESPALEAVRRWKFKPAQKDGNPVKVRVSIPLRFNLED